MHLQDVARFIHVQELHFDSTQEARRFVEKYTVRLFRDVAQDRATLRLLAFPDAPAPFVVCKDFFDVPTWYRVSIGRFLIAHEYGAYARLQGIEGVPQVFGRPHPAMMLMEYLSPGEDLWRYQRGELPPEVLTQLQRLVSAMHQRGVIHLDIGHDAHGRFGRETNLIWHEERRRLYIMDPAGALYGLPLPRAIREGLEGHDELGIKKIHDFFFPDLEYSAPAPLKPWALKLFTKLKKI